MNRPVLLGITLLAALVGMTLADGQPTAKAGFGWWGCCGGYRCGGCHVGCQGYGVRRCFGRWRCRGAARCHVRLGCSADCACSGCGGGQIAPGCSSCQGCGGCSSCTGCFGCTGCQGAAPAYDATYYDHVYEGAAWVERDSVTVVARPTDHIVFRTAGPSRSTSVMATPAADSPISAESVSFELQVPTDAVLWINGRLTASTGARRRYFSRGLAPGEEYQYELRAEVTRAGQTLTEEKTLVVRLGMTVQVALDFDPQRHPAGELPHGENLAQGDAARVAARQP